VTDTIKVEDLRAIVDKYKGYTNPPHAFLSEIQHLLPDDTMKGQDWNYDEHFLAEARLAPGWESEYAIMLGKDTFTERIRCIIKGDNSIFSLPPQELTPTGRKAKLVIDTGLLEDEDGDLWEEFDGKWAIGSSPERRKERAEIGATGDPTEFNAHPYIEEF
jgi:hypothetical protein